MEEADEKGVEGKVRDLQKAIGVDLGGTNLKTATVTKSGDPENLNYTATEAAKGPKHVIEKIIKSINEQLQRSGVKEIKGVGIGSAGQVDSRTGIVYDPPNLPHWQKEDLRKVIEEEFGLPAFVDNDANVAALAESQFGAGRDSEYLMLVTLGTGVGAGLIFHQEIFHGASGIAGEFGHFTLNHDGPLCQCGQKGCVERYVGARWIIERARTTIPDYPDSKVNQLIKESGNKLTPEHIAQLAHEGDVLSIQVMKEVGTFLGAALGSVVNLLNLDLIIIGGGISNAGSVLFDPIKKAILEHSMSIPGSMVRIRKAKLGEHAGVIGAGQLVFKGLATPP